MTNKKDQLPVCDWVTPNTCKSNKDGRCKCLTDTEFPKRDFCPFYKRKKGETEYEQH